METLSELRAAIGGEFTARARLHYRTTLTLKVLTLVGACIASAAQYFSLKPNVPLETSNYIGIGAAVLVALFGIIVTFADRDPSKILECARAALAESEDVKSELDETIADIEAYEKGVTKLISRYDAMRTMQNVIDANVRARDGNLVSVLQALIDTAGRSLSIAMGFQMDQLWTVAIYEAQLSQTDHHAMLTCVAHRRAIQCDISKARKWPEGVGVVGSTYSRGDEIIVPDLAAPELGSYLHTAGHSKPEDAKRYRSIASIPIVANLGEKPWGVVVATSDQAAHFTTDDAIGVGAAEAVRALAASVTTIVRVHQGLKTDATSTTA